MLKCYILGAVTSGSGNAEEVFNAYKEALKDKIHIIGTPLETAKFQGSFKERFTRAENAVKEADIIIAEMSEPSSGAGIELGMAYLLGKQIFIFAKEGSSVSGLIKGMVGEDNIHFYQNKQSLIENLKILANSFGK